MKKYILSLFLVGFLVIPAFSFAQVGDVDPNPQTGDCVSIVNNLRYRDRDVNKNGEVSTLQDFLQTKNYLNNEPTGYFGILTLKAVKDFQRANNINPTGYVGAITRAKIKSLTCDGTIPEPKPYERKITGYLSAQGPSTTMWGTHKIAVSQDVVCVTYPCAENAMAQSYLVRASDSLVLSDLKRYENSQVTILGEVKKYDFEGGFWGITAKKVTPVSSNSTNPVISGVSGPQTLNVNQTGTWTVKAYDKNGGDLSYFVNWGDVNMIALPQLRNSERDENTQSATFTHSYSQAGTYTPTFTVTNKSGQSATTSLSVKVGEGISTLDTTPRIMYWWGKVNQHVDANGNWQTDPDGTSGASLDKLTYCKKWFPNTVKVENYKLETINSWHDAGNLRDYTSIKMSTKCVQGNVIEKPVITILSPNGGETYNAGQRVTVNWDSNNLSRNEKVMLTLQVVNNETVTSTWLANSTPNDGTEVVTLPTIASFPTMQYGKKFKVGVILISSSSSVVDLSDNYFTITSNVVSVEKLTVLSPNGGEALIKGKTQTIKWQDNSTVIASPCAYPGVACVSPVPNYYDISLVPYYTPCPLGYRCLSMPYRIPYTIAEKVYGSSYDWTVGDAISMGTNDVVVPDGQYTIQVCKTGTATCDSSNSYFKIVAKNNVDCGIDLDRPCLGMKPIVVSPAQNVAGSVNFERELKVGLSGEDVKDLQEVLKEKGFLFVNATGYFGNLTKEAVTRYQKQNNIFNANGKVDADTLEKIKEDIQESASLKEKLDNN